MQAGLLGNLSYVNRQYAWVLDVGQSLAVWNMLQMWDLSNQ